MAAGCSNTGQVFPPTVGWEVLLALPCRPEGPLPPPTLCGVPCTHAELSEPVLAAMQHGTSPPGAAFYEERLAQARALPEAERSADVREWLRQHDELEAALAALPEVPASATPQRPLVEPLGGDAALAALLRFITAACSGPAADPQHPKATLERLSSQLPPYFRVAGAWRQGAKVTAAGGSFSNPHLSAACCLRSLFLAAGAYAGTEAARFSCASSISLGLGERALCLLTSAGHAGSWAGAERDHGVRGILGTG